MASTFEISVPYGTPLGLDAARAGLDLIDELEAQLTIYRDDSEVSRLNRLAQRRPVPVGRELYALLVQCAELHAASEGSFDITAGPLIRCWSEARRRGEMPSDEDIAAARAAVGMQHVELNPAHRSVHFQRPGMQINLGSIGKGYALDRAGETLRGWGIGSALLHGGGSSVLALGRPPHEDGWLVSLRHPWQDDCSLGNVSLRNGALGTSANTHQHALMDGKRLGHLIDPRSGQPASGVESATALAPTAAIADALATAFFIAGPEFAEALCAANPEIGAVLLAGEPDAILYVYGTARDLFAPAKPSPAAAALSTPGIP